MKKVANPAYEESQNDRASDIDEQRDLFNREGVYTTDTISHALPEQITTYSDLLLKIRLDIVRQFVTDAFVLDICCATGQHLKEFKNLMATGMGIDFSLPYLQSASLNRDGFSMFPSYFICGDAKRLPLASNCFDVAYSFSSLYIIPDVDDVIFEIARTLKPNGKCVFDLGNRYSLNVIVANSYHKDLGWAKQFPLSVVKMKRLIRKAGLRILEHRAFQTLPLWDAERPSWLKPLLWRGWAKLMSRTVAGKMVDEWVSELPVIKLIAFRHIFVCEKPQDA